MMLKLPTTDRKTEYRDYWRNQFRNDLEAVRAAAPPKAHENENIIQPRMLDSRYNPEIRRMRRRQRELFATSLFYHLALGVEPVVEEFEAPRFIGDCPGGCILDLQLVDVFYCLGRNRRGERRWQDRIPLLPLDEAKEVMKEEVFDTIRRQTPQKSPEHYWERMEGRLPYLLQFLPALQEQGIIRTREGKPPPEEG